MTYMRFLVGAVRRINFLSLAALYNLVVFVVFFGAYSTLDFKTHFGTAADLGVSGKLYFALMLHATGNTDVSPRTRTAKAVVALHVLATWAQLMLVFVS